MHDRPPIQLESAITKPFCESPTPFFSLQSSNSCPSRKYSSFVRERERELRSPPIYQSTFGTRSRALHREPQPDDILAIHVPCSTSSNLGGMPYKSMSDRDQFLPHSATYVFFLHPMHHGTRSSCSPRRPAFIDTFSLWEASGKFCSQSNLSSTRKRKKATQVSAAWSCSLCCSTAGALAAPNPPPSNMPHSSPC